MKPTRESRRPKDLQWVLLVSVVVLITLYHLGGDQRADIKEIPLESAGRLTENFEKVVFGEDLGQSVDEVAKWTRPIVILAEDGLNQQGRKALEQLAPTLERLTRLAVFILDEPDGSENTIMHLVPRSQMGEAAASMLPGADFTNGLEVINCFGWSHRNLMFKIDRSEVFIPSDGTSDRLHRCIVEEITQGLGTRADSNLITPAIFSDDLSVKDLTINDMVLVRTLYDPRLNAGMHKDEAMPIARDIIADLVAQIEAGADPDEVLSQTEAW